MPPNALQLEREKAASEKEAIMRQRREAAELRRQGAADNGQPPKSKFVSQIFFPAVIREFSDTLAQILLASPKKVCAEIERISYPQPFGCILLFSA